MKTIEINLRMSQEVERDFQIFFEWFKNMSELK